MAKIKINTVRKGVSPGSLGTRNAWDDPTALGRQGKLTRYIDAVRNFKPSARVATMSNAPEPRYDPRAYVPGQGIARSPVPAAIQQAGYLGPTPAATTKPGPTRTGSRGTGGKVAQPDTLTRILNRYIASLLTPQQQAAQTRQWIDAQIKSGIADINRSAATDRSRILQQQDRARQFALALGSMRDASGAQTEADYTNAAARIQGLGTGLTGTVFDAQQAQADQAAADIAAATGGLGKAAPLDVAGLRNVAQYTGVTMPSTDLYAEAASRAGQARVQQDMRAQQIANIAADYDVKLNEAEKQRLADVATLAGKRPSLYQEAIQGMQAGGRSDMATILSALALQNTQAKTAAEITKTGAETAAVTTKVTGFQYDPTTGKQKTDSKGNPLLATGFWLPPGATTPQKIPSDQHVSADGTKLVPNKRASTPAATAAAATAAAKAKADANVKAGYTPDGKDVGPGFFWGKDGKPKKIPQNWMLDPNDPTNKTIIKNPNVGGGGRGGVETPAHKAERIQGLITDWSDRILKGLTAEGTPYAHDTADPFDVQQGWAKPHFVPSMSYAQALAKIKAKLPAELRNNAQMLANIDDALVTVGYKPTATTTTRRTTTRTTRPARTPANTTPTRGTPGPQL